MHTTTETRYTPSQPVVSVSPPRKTVKEKALFKSFLTPFKDLTKIPLATVWSTARSWDLQPWKAGKPSLTVALHHNSCCAWSGKAHASSAFRATIPPWQDVLNSLKDWLTFLFLWKSPPDLYTQIEIIPVSWPSPCPLPCEQGRHHFLTTGWGTEAPGDFKQIISHFYVFLCSGRSPEKWQVELVTQL